jgi:3-mercaptopyruvate sulfurtransferase SseA
MVKVATSIVKSQIEEVRIATSEYKGKHLLDIRSFVAFNGDEHKPTQKGVSIPIHMIDAVIAGLLVAREDALKAGHISGASKILVER